MRTDTVSSLRQRMIEDMNARKPGSHTQRSHVSSCKRFAAFLGRRPPRSVDGLVMPASEKPAHKRKCSLWRSRSALAPVALIDG
jgi:hypothetical protein